jgi:hypothetical protein
MLYREIIAVCSEIHTKHTNTLCGQNVDLLIVKPGGTCNNRWTLDIESHKFPSCNKHITLPTLFYMVQFNIHSNIMR